MFLECLKEERAAPWLDKRWLPFQILLRSHFCLEVNMIELEKRQSWLMDKKTLKVYQRFLIIFLMHINIYLQDSVYSLPWWHSLWPVMTTKHAPGPDSSPLHPVDDLAKMITQTTHVLLITQSHLRSIFKSSTSVLNHIRSNSWTEIMAHLQGCSQE